MAAIMAALGLMQSTQQQRQRAQDLTLRAEETAMSPWSGLQPSQQITPRANPLMAAGQGFLTGYQQGGNVEEARLRNKLLEDMREEWQMRKAMGGADSPSFWGASAESFRVPRLLRN